MEHTYTPGEQVKYSQPENAREAALRFTVLEDNGNRVLVQGYIEGWTIQPTTVYYKNDIEPA